MSRFAFMRAILLAFVFGLAVPGAALADSSLSTNWAGYAVHRAGISFRSVSATWKQPAAVCGAGQTYEATWVGIGGYNANSTALEQIGTELDCNTPQPSAAWYEIVPAPSRQLQMTIKPGDTISAGVTVVGRRVTLALADRTRHETFSKTMTVSAVDVRSAEWIVEAPSGCYSDNTCRTLPLTDFGKVSFSSARATTSKGRHGSISSGLWNRSKITLAPVGRTFIASGSQGRAVPSALVAGGSAFSVTYTSSAVSTTSDLFAPRAIGPAPVGTVEPGGARR